MKNNGSFSPHVKLPVMVCWNNDCGDFAGEIVSVDIHDSIEILTHFVNDDHSFSGLKCALEEGLIVIGEHKFPFFNHLTWVGNMLWDLVWMRGADLLAFLNYLKETKHFSVEQADSELFDRWDGDQPFNETELALIANLSSTFRL